MNESTFTWDMPLEAAAEEPRPRVEYQFEFRGSGAEYFRIWIVNLLLSIVTLGIFSAWAKVRRLRYFYGNTLLDGHSFDYHARGITILKGRVVVFAGYVLFLLASQFYPKLFWGLIPLFIVGMPWVMLRSLRFQMRMTSWRNLRMSFGGRYGPAMGAYVGWWLILAAAVFFMMYVPMNNRFILIICAGVALAYPFFVHKRVEYTLDNASYGRSEFGFFTSIGRFYLFCVITAVLSIAAYFLFVYLFVRLDSVQEALRQALADERPIGVYEMILSSGPKGWAMVVAAAITGFALVGFYKSQLINATFSGLRLGVNEVKSRLSAWNLMWINVTNLLGILVTLGIYFPWAKVRLWRYQLEMTTVNSDGRMAQFAAADPSDTHALGEEASDFLNVDLAI